MAPISTLIRVEIAKLVRRPMTWVLAIVLIAFFFLIYGSLIAAILAAEAEGSIEGIDPAELRDTMFLPDGIFFGVALLQQLGSILLVILAAGSFGSEFSWATLRTNIFMGATRLRLLAAKLLTLELFALLTVVVGIGLTIIAALVSELILGNEGVERDWTASAFLSDVLLSFVVAFVAITVWIVIASAVTLITHSLATGLGVTLALSLLGGQIALLIGQLGTVGEWISRIFPNAATDAILALLSDNPEEYVATDWLWISVNLVGWTVLLIVLAVTRFRRMNLLATAS